MSEKLNYLSFTVSTVGYIPFIVAILWKKNRQNPVTWFGFLLINSTLLANSLTSESPNAPLAAYELGIFCIMLISLKYGAFQWEKLDQFMLAATAAIMLFWMLVGKEAATVLAITAVYVSTLPMWQEQYRNPSFQPRIPWALWLLGSLLQLASKGDPSGWKLFDVLPTLGLMFQQALTLTLSFAWKRRW